MAFSVVLGACRPGIELIARSRALAFCCRRAVAPASRSNWLRPIAASARIGSNGIPPSTIPASRERRPRTSARSDAERRVRWSPDTYSVRSALGAGAPHGTCLPDCSYHVRSILQAIGAAGIGLDGYYRAMWVKDQMAEAAETQESCLRRVVSDRNPQRIGINYSTETAFGDGLSSTDREWLTEALGTELASRTTEAQDVAVGWLETRLPEEIETANGINQIAHGIIGEAFSSRVVHPGISTAADVAWWMRQRVSDLGLSCWFHPTVSIQRRGVPLGELDSDADAVIRLGDLLHCDFGLHYLGLATDTQQNAYVLRLGEQQAPDGFKRALARANRQQDLLAEQMVTGRSGNEILQGTLTAMKADGLTGRIYSHPIGYHGHGAGPMIGRYDRQDNLPGAGEFALHDDTLFSFEMYVDEYVPEWGDQVVRFKTEQIAAFTDGRIVYLGGRQTELHLIQ